MPASSESRRTDSRAEPRCSRMNSPRSCQRLGVSAGTQSSVLPRFSGIGRPAVPGLSSVSEPCERPLQASPTKDALDSTLFECCPTKTGGGEVEAVSGRCASARARGRRRMGRRIGALGRYRPLSRPSEHDRLVLQAHTGTAPGRSQTPTGPGRMSDCRRSRPGCLRSPRPPTGRDRRSS